EGARGARGAARRGHTGQVQREQHVLTLAIGERAGGKVRQAILCSRQRATELAESVSQLARLTPRFGGALIALASCHRERSRDGDGGANVLVPRATAPLLRPSQQLRVDAHAIANVQQSSAAGPKLVPA